MPHIFCRRPFKAAENKAYNKQQSRGEMEWG